MRTGKRVPEHSSCGHSTSEELLPFETESITTIDDVLKTYFSIDTDSVIRIGKFEACGWTGQGGQSTVIKAIDPDLHRDVAIKLYHAGMDEQQKQRLLSEGRALARTDSPYIAKCYSVDMFAHAPFLVLEWVPGTTLDTYWEGKEVDEHSVRTMFTKILEGVGALHQQQLVHRDLKPGNIVVTQEGDPKIIDLGLAHHLESSAPSAGGTYSYMAPEVARQEFDKVGIPTDIFGLGAILYFMLVGEPLYVGDSKNEAKAQAESCSIPDLDQASKIGSRDLIEVCTRCLHEDRNERFQSVGEILERLNVSRSWRKSSVSALVVGICVFVIGGLVVAMMTDLAGGFSSQQNASPLRNTVAQKELPPLMQVLDLAHRESPIQAARVASNAIDKLVLDENHDYVLVRRLYELLVKVNLQSGSLETAIENQNELLQFEESMPMSRLQSLVIAETRIDGQQLVKLHALSKVEMEELRLGISNLLRSQYLFEEGHFDQAVLPSRLSVERFESTVGIGHFLSIAALQQFTEAQYAADERAEMEQTYEKLGGALVAVYGELSRQHCIHLAELTQFLRSLRRLDAALACGTRAVEIAKQLVDDEDRFLKNFEMLCGQIMVQQKTPSGTAKLEATLDSIAAEVPDSLVAAARIDLAEAWFERQNLVKSEQSLKVAKQHVKEMREKGFPQTDIMAARALALEGNIESARGRFENAIELHEQALVVLPNVKKQTVSHTEFLKVFVRTLLRVAESKSTEEKLADRCTARARVLISEAIAILNQCLSVQDENYALRMAELRCLSGQIELSTQNPESAFAEFQVAIQQYQTLTMNTARTRRLSGFHSWAGDALIETGQLQKAKRQLEQGRELLHQLSLDEKVPENERKRIKFMELGFLDRQLARVTALQLERDKAQADQPLGASSDAKHP